MPPGAFRRIMPPRTYVPVYVDALALHPQSMVSYMAEWGRKVRQHAEQGLELYPQSGDLAQETQQSAGLGPTYPVGAPADLHTWQCFQTGAPEANR